jgi:hypothetical protein
LDLADFATTQHLIHWPAQTKTLKNLPAVAYRAKPFGPTVGISRISQRDMPTVGPTIARSATVGKLDAESKQNPPDLVNQFSHRWMWYQYSTDYCLKTADFQTEKSVRDH